MKICFVHAHPDDETISTGALILYLVEQGHQVDLVTATRGELGEVVPGELSHLAGTPELVTRREQELAGAVAAIGISEHVFLGSGAARAGEGERRYQDSGMQWISEDVAGPAESMSEAALCAADMSDVVADLTAWLEATQPELVITYADDGGYGHPDHVRCHQAATQAAEQVRVPVAYVVAEKAEADQWLELDRFLPQLNEALHHHATQVSVEERHIVHSGGQRQETPVNVGLVWNPPRRWTHVIWDMGGTMIDTYPQLDQALADVVQEHGKDVELDEVAKLTRRSTSDAIDALSERFDIPAEEFEAANKALKAQWKEHPAPTMPHLKQVMAAVPGLNIVVTHRDRESATSLLDKSGIEVDDLICTSDGFPRKPDPAMYVDALTRHGLDPADVVGIGDRPIDAEAAHAAGMGAIMLETPGIPLESHGAVEIDDLRYLLGQLKVTL